MAGVFRQVPFHPVRQVGFIGKVIIHRDRYQHDRAKTACHFGRCHADDQHFRYTPQHRGTELMQAFPFFNAANLSESLCVRDG